MQSPESSNISSVPGAVPSRACQNCSKAKAKCVPLSDHEQCARCFRLKKVCAAVSKTTRKRRSPNAAKNTDLEQKIESLVTLLSANKTALPVPSIIERQPNQSTLDVIGQHDQEHIKGPGHQPTYSWVPEPPLNASDNSSTWASTLPASQVAALTPCSRDTPAFSTTDSNATPSIDIQVHNPERVLKLYREQYEIDFPFVIIPLGMSFPELKARRPWVATTISMVASHENRSQQLALAKQILLEFATALLMRSERSLDLLEALVIFNTWQFSYAQGNPHYQSTAVMQLALAALYDLGLNKPPRENEGPDVLADTFRLTADATKELRRPLEERRAFLSCFVMTSSLACNIKKIDGLEPNSYLDYNCQVLSEAAQYPSDLVLVFMVRSQILVSSMTRHLSNNLFQVPGSTLLTEIKAPQLMQAKSAKVELQGYLMALPSKTQEQNLVRQRYHSAEIFIYESSLHRVFFPLNQNSQRLDMLYACLIAAKSFLDVFLSMPITLCNSMSIITGSQFGHAMSTAFKLSFIEVPGWDLKQVRVTLDLNDYLEQVISRFAQAGAQIDDAQAIPVRRSFPTGASLAMGRIKGWYETRIAAEAEKGEQEIQAGLNLDDVLAGAKFDYFDDAYLMADWNWEDVMGDFMQE